jgi:uncharacterized protein
MHMYLEANMPIDMLDDKYRTPLMAAARAGATYMCAMLIAKGADVRRQDRNGWTCLHHAATAGHDKVVAYLCSRLPLLDPLHPNTLDAQALTNGYTALHITAFNDARNIAASLLDVGASVSLRSTDGKTPLTLANERGSNRFLAAVADIHKGKYDQRHPLGGDRPVNSRFTVSV